MNNIELMELLEKMVNVLGAETLLEDLCYAMSNSELEKNLIYTANNRDISFLYDDNHDLSFLYK